MELVKFEPEHIDLFDWDTLGTQFKGAIFNRDMILAVAMHSASVYTAIIDGRAVAFGGVVMVWKGVAEAWSVLSPEAVVQIKPLHRRAKEMLDGFFISGQTWRIQTTVLEGFLEGYRWAEHLGFQWEGPMQRYGPDGRNYIRFARVEGG